MFLQISGKRKTTSGKMEDRENGKTPAQLKDELSGLKMRALQQKAEEVGVAQDQIGEADDSKEDLIDLILAVAPKRRAYSPGAPCICVPPDRSRVPDRRNDEKTAYV